MALQASDRRRANGPLGGTLPAVFWEESGKSEAPKRSRPDNSIRKIFLRKGVVPSASGSAYLELEQPKTVHSAMLVERTATVKISCAVHGPKPVARSAPFSGNLLLSTHVKFAPFATRVRRGYVRDSTERDLAVHVDTALRSVVLAERWPKSGVDVVITILEGDEHEQLFSSPSSSSSSSSGPPSDDGGGGLNATFGPDSLALMSILSGCITAASLALTDAGIDCVDIVTGGVAALVPTKAAAATAAAALTSRKGSSGQEPESAEYHVVQDPVPSEHGDAVAACVVGYLRSRDEYADVWMLCSPSGKHSSHDTSTMLLEGAVQAAISSQRVVVDLLKDG